MSDIFPNCHWPTSSLRVASSATTSRASTVESQNRGFRSLESTMLLHGNRFLVGPCRYVGLKHGSPTALGLDQQSTFGGRAPAAISKAAWLHHNRMSVSPIISVNI